MKDHDKLATRLAQILIKLHQGEILCTQTLAQEFGVSVRTIQRDLSRFALLKVSGGGGGGECPFKTHLDNQSKTLISAQLHIQRAGVPQFLHQDLFVYQEARTLENGDLLVSISCDNADKILNWIKSSIPYAKLLGPEFLKDKLKAQLEEYLKSCFNWSQ